MGTVKLLVHQETWTPKRDKEVEDLVRNCGCDWPPIARRHVAVLHRHGAEELTITHPGLSDVSLAVTLASHLSTKTVTVKPHR